jgi:hypothetical protein
MSDSRLPPIAEKQVLALIAAAVKAEQDTRFAAKFFNHLLIA